MSASQEPGYGVQHSGTGGGVAHGGVHISDDGVGHSTEHEHASFWDDWWPLFVILFGFLFFLIVSHWHPSY